LAEEFDFIIAGEADKVARAVYFWPEASAMKAVVVVLGWFR
jgi:hypothetical protein